MINRTMGMQVPAELNVLILNELSEEQEQEKVVAGFREIVEKIKDLDHYDQGAYWEEEKYGWDLALVNVYRIMTNILQDMKK